MHVDDNPQVEEVLKEEKQEVPAPVQEVKK
jgi:hypothetical protein